MQRESAPQLLGFIPIGCNVKSAAASVGNWHQRGCLKLIGEVGEHARRGEVELQQPLLAPRCLADRSEHPGRDRRGAGAKRLTLDDACRETPLRGAPGA